MTCDHANCKTAFCPHCGKNLGGSIPLAIRQQITRAQKACNAHLESRRTDLRGHLGDEWYKRRVERSERGMAKYDTWLAWIDAAIAREAAEKEFAKGA